MWEIHAARARISHMPRTTVAITSILFGVDKPTALAHFTSLGVLVTLVGGLHVWIVKRRERLVSPHNNSQGRKIHIILMGQAAWSIRSLLSIHSREPHKTPSPSDVKQVNPLTPQLREIRESSDPCHICARLQKNTFPRTFPTPMTWRLPRYYVSRCRFPIIQVWDIIIGYNIMQPLVSCS
jgi:hypothetical protein